MCDMRYSIDVYKLSKTCVFSVFHLSALLPPKSHYSVITDLAAK